MDAVWVVVLCELRSAALVSVDAVAVDVPWKIVFPVVVIVDEVLVVVTCALDSVVVMGVNVVSAVPCELESKPVMGVDLVSVDVPCELDSGPVTRVASVSVVVSCKVDSAVGIGVNIVAVVVPCELKSVVVDSSTKCHRNEDSRTLVYIFVKIW